MTQDQIKSLTEISERSKSNTHRIDKLEQQTQLMHEMNKNIAIIAEQSKDTKDNIKMLQLDLEEIKSKPTRFLENLKENTWGYILGAIIGAFMALII